MKGEEWSVTYASYVCKFLLWLQNLLINTRPVFSIVALALILSLLVFVLLLLFLVLPASAPLIALAMEFMTKPNYCMCNAGIQTRIYIVHMFCEHLLLVLI